MTQTDRPRVGPKTFILCMASRIVAEDIAQAIRETRAGAEVDFVTGLARLPEAIGRAEGLAAVFLETDTLDAGTSAVLRAIEDRGAVAVVSGEAAYLQPPGPGRHVLPQPFNADMLAAVLRAIP